MSWVDGLSLWLKDNRTKPLLDSDVPAVMSMRPFSESKNKVSLTGVFYHVVTVEWFGGKNSKLNSKLNMKKFDKEES